MSIFSLKKFASTKGSKTVKYFDFSTVVHIGNRKILTDFLTVAIIIWKAFSIFGREKNKGKSFAKVACQDYAVPVL